MIKETHTVELTVEQVAAIIKAELTIHGEFKGDWYKFNREIDEDREEQEVLQFTYEIEPRELPF